MSASSDPGVYRLRGYLGILSKKLRVDVQLDMQERLTLQMKSWNDAPDVDVKAFYKEGGYFWIPRFFFPNAISKRKLGKHDIAFEWTSGAPTNLPFNAILDPTRGQPAAVDRMVQHLKENSGGILQADTGCGKTILGYAIGHRLNTTIGVLVYNSHMVKNWVETAKWLFDLGDDDIGIVQRDRCDLGKPVTIMMVQSLLSEKAYPAELYDQFGYICADECVTGDTIIHTDVGPVPIEKIPSSGATEALSFSVSNGRWQTKRIIRWVPRGPRKTLEIRAGETVIRCTREHLFLTNHGWLPASQLRPGFRVLSPAPVGAATNSITMTPVEGSEVSYQSTLVRPNALYRRGSARVGELKLRGLRRPVSAGAVSLLSCSVDLNKKGALQSNGQDSSSGIMGQSSTGSRLALSAWDWFTVHFLETHRSQSRRVPELVQGSISPMERSSNSGLSIRRSGYTSSGFQQRLPLTLAMVCCPVVVAVVVTQVFPLFWMLLAGLSLLMLIGWRAFLKRGGLGGIWTMDRSVEAEFDSVPRDFHARRLTRLPATCVAGSSIPSLIDPKESIGSFGSGWPIPYGGSNASDSFLPLEWITNFLTITEIVDDPVRGVEEVYDLEVEDNHNFVANGVLVHNCNRFGAPQWNEVMKLFSARYRVGMSADPTRADGLDKLIQWHFGDIAHKVVMKKPKPTVVQVFYNKTYHISQYTNPWKRTPRGDPMPDPLKYDKTLAEDTGRNEWLVGELVKMRKRGRKILVFSRLVDHLKDLKRMFESRWTGLNRVAIDDESEEGQFFEEDTKVTLLIGGLEKRKKDKGKLDAAMRGDVIFCTYAFGRDAMNIPHIDTELFATPPGKPLQPIGRLRDKGPADRQPLMAVDPYENVPYSIRKARRREETYIQLGSKVTHLTKAPI